MNSEDISEIKVGGNEEKIKEVLDKFLKKFGESFNLSILTTTGQWTLLWNSLFEVMKTSMSVKRKCLQAIRILSRDKTYLNETIKDEQFDCLLGLANIGVKPEENETSIHSEALKVLCNLVFQSPKCQELCLKNTAVEGILKRLRTYKDQDVEYEIKYFDMKLLFLITALTPNVRSKVRDDCHGLVYLVETLDMLMESSAQNRTLETNDINLINEILKVLFNITVTNSTTVETDEDEEQQLKRLAIVLHELLSFEPKSQEAKEDYHSNIINLLTNIPIPCYSDLVPAQATGDAESSENFENYNVHTINIFLDFLELKLDNIFGTKASKDYEQVQPITTVMIKAVRSHSVVRRYVRLRILPPLRDDVKKRPEDGTALRNRLCKLLTYPSTQISDLVAELLFILCKENVGRMIKYTGYGNAAGLFAKRGLLGGRNSENQQNYSSDSEDSDTEEYKSLQHAINPVIGCYEDLPKFDPFEGMLEEQKEYEAEKLANLIDSLDRKGLIKPCKIDEATGKPVPVEHVLELQSEIPEQQKDHKRKT